MKHLQKIRDLIKGRIVLPDDPGYDSSRKIWNAMIDRRPGAIAYCTSTEDVAAIVKFASENSVLVSVRSGGHNVAGNALCDEGIVIDLSAMKTIAVDTKSRIVKIGAGCTLGDMDLGLKPYGLAVPCGIVTRTGVAGLTLGGGIGWLMRRYGLTCDNLVGAEVVTANGDVVFASDRENPDLFWALRGGGGNFGIVTRFEFNAYPIERVYSGMVMYPASRIRKVLELFGEGSAGMSPDFTMMFVYLKVPGSSEYAVAVEICYIGDDVRQDLPPFDRFGPQLQNTLREMPYIEMQAMNDHNSPPGLRNYWKSAFIKPLSEDAIQTITEYAQAMTSPIGQIHIQQLGGAVSDLPDEATAFSNRDAGHVLNIVTKWESPEEDDKHMRWTRQFHAAMQPYSSGGAYVNFMSNEAHDAVKNAYGEAKYRKLRELKRKYDPENFFRLNQNIKPV